MRSNKPHKPDPPSPSCSGEAPVAEPTLSADERRQAFIEAEVERAMVLWEGLFPPDVLEAFRERTAIFLATHPDMVRCVDAALRAPPAAHSEIVATGAAAAPSAKTGPARVKRRRKPGDGP